MYARSWRKETRTSQKFSTLQKGEKMKNRNIKPVLCYIVLLLQFTVVLTSKADIVTVPKYISWGQTVDTIITSETPGFPGPPDWEGNEYEAMFYDKWMEPVLVPCEIDEGSFTCEESLLRWVMIKGWVEYQSYCDHESVIWYWVQYPFGEWAGGYYYSTFDIALTSWTKYEAVPEPATIALLCFGSLAMLRRRRQGS